MAFPYLDAAIAVALIGRYIHRQVTRAEPNLPRGQEVQVPRVEEGSPIPIVFGRCRVRQPILIGALEPRADYAIIATSHEEGEPLDWGCNMTFVIGAAGFTDGTNRLHGVWAGELELPRAPGSSPRLEDLTGGGNFETPTVLLYQFEDPDGNYNGGGLIGGSVEFLNGNSSQVVVGAAFPYTPATVTGENLAAIDTGARVPGLRGYLSAQLFESQGLNAWTIGREPNASAYSFEVSCYPSSALYQQKIGGTEANPADVLWWLLHGSLVGLGLPTSMLDYASFAAGAERLHNEGHGYSRCFEENMEASAVVMEVLRQIDGLIYENPLTGLICLKLVRQDYNPRDLRTITPDNCEGLENFAAGGLTGLPNKVRVTFTNRHNGYAVGSAQTHSFVGAAGLQSDASELQLDYPGVCTQTLADAIAARELDARSRPLLRCTAVVDRNFWNVMPGDVVNLAWPALNIGTKPMRVGAVSRGPSDSNTLRLDLVEEFFTFNRLEPDGTGMPHHEGAVE